MEEKESQEVPNYSEQLCVYVCLATPPLDTLQSGRNPPPFVCDLEEGRISSATREAKGPELSLSIPLSASLWVHDPS